MKRHHEVTRTRVLLNTPCERLNISKVHGLNSGVEDLQSSLSHVNSDEIERKALLAAPGS
eukprot:CAMPEP_0185774970 /NCGR_PEP_ID=MMETSP1174-20130828/80630_1 /TAXON_ID=35687 /ORGANISM="Dictyocha speculum, Strain CCMP1381" /LENGTH=59 /DNA_ID=CAMNT_0028462389 /DNA_START=431 /DNA_END=610 /DNA_ORIENTATION=-